MAIDTLDKLIASMGNAAQQIIWNKASIANQLTGGFSSLWRATGNPGQGAIPAAGALCDNTLLGAGVFTNPVGGLSSYLGRHFSVSGNAATDIQIHDRLAHMGGLSGSVTTAQAVNVDVSGSGSNLTARRGASDYSDLCWWLEIYTDIGTTGVTATVTYTRAPGGAGDTGRTTTLAIGGTSPANRAGRLFPIVPVAGEYIQSIQSIQHTTTGTAGSYGITVSRSRASVSMGLANAGVVADWAYLGLPKIEDSSCIWLVMVCGTTSTGTLYGVTKVIQG